MDGGILIALIAVLIGPFAILMHYITKWKEMKSFSPEDEASIGDMRGVADRLESRVRTLERILDDEVPHWRSRKHDV